MPRKAMTSVLVALLLPCLLGPLPAAAQSTTRSNTTLGDRLDKLGKNLIGVFTPDRYADDYDESNYGTVPDDAPTVHPSSKAAPTRADFSSGAAPHRTSVLADASGDMTPTRAQSTQSPTERVTMRSARPSPSEPQPAAVSKSSTTETAPEFFGRPLHERLMGFQQSAFNNTAPTLTQPSRTNVQTRPVTPSATTPPTSAEAGQPTRAPTPTRVATRPTRVSNNYIERPETAPGPSNEQPSPAAAQSGSRVASPSRAPRQATRPVSPAARATTDETAEAATTTAAVKTAASKAKPAANHSAQTAQSSNQPNDRVLFTRQSPILNVQTLGPRQIMVGKESSYEVSIENSGRVAANDVVVLVALPDWAEVLGAQATVGTTLSDQAPGGPKQLRWQIGVVEAAAQEKLVLRIVPRKSQPIELGVRWEFTPAASQALIEVQEPRLEMELDGPREVLFGETNVFKLQITNSGTGVAEDILLTLMPITPGAAAPTSHQLGSVPAGETKTIEIELTARQKGQLAVQAQLKCDDRVHAEINEPILVRKADVQLAIEGPRMQYVGTVASYQIRVHNPGNATANQLTVTAAIPPEATFLSADHDGKPTADGTKVVWNLDALDEGAEQMLRFECQLVRDGLGQIETVAAGDGDLAASAVATTRIESIADLALEVVDPAGPVPVGEQATYEVRIHNRGTRRAVGVDVLAYFSKGIEPVAVEGGSHRIGPGQVVFDAIGDVPAGKQIVLKIHAKADTPGNHMFRAEVHCKALNTRLVGEETTHFYGEDVNVAQTRDAAPQR